MLLMLIFLSEMLCLKYSECVCAISIYFVVVVNDLICDRFSTPKNRKVLPCWQTVCVSTYAPCMR